MKHTDMNWVDRNYFSVIWLVLFVCTGVLFAADDAAVEPPKTKSEQKISAENAGKPEPVGDDDEKEKEKDYFAIIGDQTISKADYLTKLQLEVRQKYFHAKVPEKEMEQYREKVGQEYINRVLLLKEAVRQGVVPDKETVDAKLANYEAKKKRKNDLNWEKNKERLLPGLREEYEEDSLIKLLEKKTKEVADPKEKELKTHFENNPDLFTIPEQLRVFTILLKVDPSSGSQVWQDTTELAEELISELRNGSDFAELARIHSGDESAPQGGDMGYIHKGMLAKPAQVIIDIMEPGDISEPVVILQGVALFRLDERIATTINSYDKVKETVVGLVVREKGQQAWTKLLKKLRSETKIDVDESLYKVVKK